MNTRDKFGISNERFRKTYSFVEQRLKANAIILDIGEKNGFTEYFSKRKTNIIVNTDSDLDYDIQPVPDGVNTIFCFEVIEHLMNPRLFFDNLWLICDIGTDVFLSFPSRPKIFWNNDEHFHEYDSLRFNHLLYKTGFYITEKQNIYVKHKPKGIRPILRNVIPQTTIYLIKKLMK